MKNLYLCLVLLLVAMNPAHSQNLNNHWQLGVSDVNFTTNLPIVTTVANAGQYGNASISDANGNLLFYTDGTKVFTKSHTVMQNGDNINSLYINDINSQPAIIVPNPAMNGQYYVFTSIVEHMLCLSCNERNIYKFSLVDFNNPTYPLGEVVSNQYLFENAGYFGPLTLVKNATNDGYFIITQSPGNPGVLLNAYQLTSSGLNVNPISTYNTNDIGYTGSSNSTSDGIIKFSPNGLKLGELVKTTYKWSPNVYGTRSRFVTFDFNNTTGIFSNYTLIQDGTTSFDSGSNTSTGAGYMTDFEFSNSSDKVFIISNQLYVKDLTIVGNPLRVLSELGNSSSIPSSLKSIQRDKYGNILISSGSLINNQNKFIHKIDLQDSYLNASIVVNAISLNNNTIGYLPQLIPTFVTSACPNSLSITANATSGQDNKQAANTIVASNTINSGTSAIYHAGSSVTLVPPFHAKSGSTLHTYIAGCTGTFLAKQVQNGGSKSKENPSATVSDKVEKHSIQIAPNPNDGIFSINSNDITNGFLLITDIYGVIIYQLEFKNQSLFEMNLQDKPNGIYIVKILTGGQSYTTKFIKV